MSGRRRPPEPAIPVGQAGDHQLAPPEPFVPEPSPEPPQYLMSTDPADGVPVPMQTADDEVPEAPFAAPEEEGVELSPEEEVMFASLLTCGRRTKTLRVLDHTVVVESLNCDDDLRIGLYMKDYTGTIGEQRAYQVGVAAAGIRTIDGRPLVQQLYPDADAFFDEKVAKVVKMYPTVVGHIYRAVIDAEKEFVELVTRLGKLPG